MMTVEEAQIAYSAAQAHSVEAQGAVRAFEARIAEGDGTVTAQELLEARHEVELAAAGEIIALAALQASQADAAAAAATAIADAFVNGYEPAVDVVRQRLGDIARALERFEQAVQDVNGLVFSTKSSLARMRSDVGGRFQSSLGMGGVLDGVHVAELHGDEVLAFAIADALKRLKAPATVWATLQAYGGSVPPDLRIH